MVRNLMQSNSRPACRCVCHVEDWSGRIELDQDGDDQQHRPEQEQAEEAAAMSMAAFGDLLGHGHVAAMQGDGGKLAEIFHRRAPGEAVIEIRDDANVDLASMASETIS